MEELLPFGLELGHSTFLLWADDSGSIERFGAEIAPALREAVARERQAAHRGRTSGHEGRGWVAVEDNVRVVDNAEEQRYELWVDDDRAGVIEYESRPGVVLIHTEIDPEFRGRGLATRLVEGALRDLQARGLKLVPVCPVVRSYLRRHPHEWDLVVPVPDAKT